MDEVKCPGCGRSSKREDMVKLNKRRHVCKACNEDRVKAERLRRIRMAQEKINETKHGEAERCES